MPTAATRPASASAGIRLIVGLLGASLLLGACGSSGGSAAPTTAGTAGTPTSAASQPAASEPAETSEPSEAAESQKASAPAQTLDACALLPVADVKTITGADTKAAVEPEAQVPDWAAGECWWNNDNMSVRFSLDVGTKASIAKSDTGATVDEQMSISRSVYAVMGKVVDEAGLGDEAIYSGGFLLVKKGDGMFQLYALQLKEEQLVALAKVVLSHL